MPQGSQEQPRAGTAEGVVTTSSTTTMHGGQRTTPDSASDAIVNYNPSDKGSKKQKWTKQQLARLEDPTDFHVMPSSFDSKLRENAQMPPPKRVLPKQKILDEDDFAEGIGAIVQRDFFPDLPKLKAQLAYLEASERGDADKMEEISSMYTRSLRRKLHGDAVDTPTPGVTSRGGETPIDPSAQAQALRANAIAADDNVHAAARHKGGLDSWLAVHNGEDNASFEEIHQKDQERHREKHWWVWNDGAKAGQGFRTLKDGTVERIAGNPNRRQLALKSATERELSSASKSLAIQLATESVVAGKAGEPAQKLGAGAGMGVGGWKGDDRPANMDMVPYRNRNHLMFQPQLSVSREICGLPPQPDKAIVEFQKDKNGRNLHKAPKEIKHSNTRFVGDPEAYNEAAAVVAAVAEKERAAKQKKGHQMGGGNYDYVATPQIIPGEDVTPLMTWGSVEGTPLILRDAAGMTPLNLKDNSHTDFKIQSSGRRERLANKLEAEAREKQKRKRERASSLRRRPTPGTTPAPAFSSKRSRRTPLASPLMTPAQRRLSMMSPAARQMAQRLARSKNSSRSAFGGTGMMDAQLRSTYTTSGSGRTRRSSSLRRSLQRQATQAPTPQMSPNVSKSTGPRRRQRSGGEGPSKATAPITDNLLKL